MATAPLPPELIIEEHKHDTRGRRIADPQRKAQIVAGCATSGLTQKAYARREGINYHTLVAWLGQNRRHGGDAAAPATPSAEMTAPRFAQVGWMPPAAASRLEVVLPDGVTVRGDDPEALVIVLRALTSPRSC
jgi:transposase-like protein